MERRRGGMNNEQEGRDELKVGSCGVGVAEPEGGGC